MWSNYKLDKKPLKQPYLAASFVAPKLLKLVGLSLSDYYQFVDDVSSCYSAIHQNLLMKIQRVILIKGIVKRL